MAADQTLRILFVCTANVCRSPMAAAFLTKHAAAADIKLTVSSAGVDDELRARHPLAMTIVGESGWTISKESKPLSAPLVGWADVILTMTGKQAITVASRFRAARTKVFMLDHFVQIAPERRVNESLEDWLAEMWVQPRSYPTQPGAKDITDPMGKTEEVFRGIADQLDKLTLQLVQVLTAEPS